MADSVAKDRNHRTIDELVGFDGAQRIVVHDRWSGMADFSTSLLSIDLVRGDRGGFAGGLHVVIDDQEEKSAHVELSPRAARGVLQCLGNARTFPGGYTPCMEHTDDNPAIELVVDSGTRFAYFFSESQGDFHAPWGACINGQLLTLPGADVGRALQTLRGLVTGDGLREGLLDFLRRRPHAESEGISR